MNTRKYGRRLPGLMAAMVIGASTVFVMSTPAFAALGYTLTLWRGDNVASVNTSNMAVTGLRPGTRRQRRVRTVRHHLRSRDEDR
jgi:hypothetical protein